MQFRYQGSIIQNDWEIEEDINSLVLACDFQWVLNLKVIRALTRWAGHDGMLVNIKQS